MSHSSNPGLRFRVKPSQRIEGEISVPGDKSVSHRSIIFGSLAKGRTHVSGFLEGEDSLNTLKAFAKMGVNIEHPSAGNLVIDGVGLQGLKAPSDDLDLGNSGTAMRLMSGVLSGQAFASKMIGDESLSGRPMGRVINPLNQMNAKISGDVDNKPPLLIEPSEKLSAIHYICPMASAQVKSAVLLAGLYAKGETKVTEPAITRDHTERMLRGFGYDVKVDGLTCSLQGGGELLATDVVVPSDISSAAFFMVAASIAKDSKITLKQVGMNPTRTGVIDILRLMGADITVNNEAESGGEYVADISVCSAELQGIEIPVKYVSLAIDEFPAIFIAAACAKGKTVLSGAEELRVKESDRIQVMVDGLTQLGISATALADGAIIEGGQLQGGEIESHGDHRISMSFAMAAFRANGNITINQCDNVKTSFPGFVELAKAHGLNIEQL